MKIFLILITLSSFLFGVDNVSLSKLLVKFQGNEYNILLAPKHIVTHGRGKKTKKAINKGYKRAVSELIRIVRMRDIELNLKIFSKNGSTLDQYKEQDSQTFEILQEMLVAQVTISESINFDTQSTPTTSNVNSAVTADDIDMDMDFGDDAFDISDESATSSTSGASMTNISPAEAFTASFVEMSELYNQEVVQLHQALHPFDVKGEPKMKDIHSVFGMAFFPTKNGSIKSMRIYMVLCNINTEEDSSVQIIAKEIKEFRWDRNHLYISGSTGKILRQIISGVIGESFL